MSHFAKIEDGFVVAVIVADQEFIDTLPKDEVWIQTSYNTKGNVHYGSDGTPDGGIALRKNYAGIGYTYNSELDAFIPPTPYPSWVLNTDTGLWGAPVPMPQDGKDYYWDEPTLSWQESVK